MVMTGKACWQHFAHEADIGVRGSGATQAEAFEQAACALTAVITDLDRVEKGIKVELQCEAPNTELLLVDWLNALVYEMAVRHLLFSRFEVQITEGTLKAAAWGESLDATRHQPAVEVKGATMTELKVEQDAQGHWLAQCVVDV